VARTLENITQDFAFAQLNGTVDAFVRQTYNFAGFPQSEAGLFTQADNPHFLYF
jgi:hypothetical protein